MARPLLAGSGVSPSRRGRWSATAVTSRSASTTGSPACSPTPACDSLRPSKVALPTAARLGIATSSGSRTSAGCRLAHPSGGERDIGGPLKEVVHPHHAGPRRPRPLRRCARCAFGVGDSTPLSLEAHANAVGSRRRNERRRRKRRGDPNGVALPSCPLTTVADADRVIASVARTTLPDDQGVGR